jgi:integrase
VFILSPPLLTSWAKPIGRWNPGEKLHDVPRRGLDFIDTNPVKQFSKRHIRESPPRTTYPTPEQMERLVAYASPMAGRIIRFLAETGMRLEEVCSMEWSQVSILRREVRLIKTKSSGPRVVPLSDAAIGTLVGTPRQITLCI